MHSSNLPKSARGPFRRILLALALMLAALSVGATVSACKGEKAEEKPEKKDGIEVFEGDKPTWPSELADVKFGQSREEWEAAGVIKKGDYAIKSKQFKKTEYEPDSDHDTHIVNKLRVVVRHDGPVKDELTKRWGEPMTLESGGGSAEYHWLNTEEKVRASVRDDSGKFQSVTFERYMPLAEMFAGEGGPMAFEKDKPVLGMTAEEILAAHPDTYLVHDGAKVDQGSFRFPPHEYESYETRISPSFRDDGKLSGYSMSLDVPDAKKAEVLALIDAKFGEAREAKDARLYYQSDLARRIKVETEAKNTISLRVETYLPVESLFADKARLVFEGDASWIGTMTKAKWKEVATGIGDQLELPPTDFEQYATFVSPRFENDVLVGYSISFGSDLVPDSKKELLERFKKALGEPTEGKPPYGDGIQYTFQTTPPILVEDSFGGNGWRMVVGKK